MKHAAWTLALLLWPTPPARAADEAPRVAFENYTLPNGLRVILLVDRKIPIVHVNAAARKYAVPSKSSILLVGDAAKIEGPVMELNAGEVVRLDAEGVPVASN